MGGVVDHAAARRRPRSGRSDGRALAAVAAVDDPVLEGMSLLMKSYTLPITGDLDAAFAASLEALPAVPRHRRGLPHRSGAERARHDQPDAGDYRRRRGRITSSGGDRARAGQRPVAGPGAELAGDDAAVAGRGRRRHARYIDESAGVFSRRGQRGGREHGAVRLRPAGRARGRLRRAAVARGAVEDIRRRIGINVWPVVAGVEQQFVTQVRDALGEDEYEAALAEGAAVAARRRRGRARHGCAQGCGDPALRGRLRGASCRPSQAQSRGEREHSDHNEPAARRRKRGAVRPAAGAGATVGALPRESRFGSDPGACAPRSGRTGWRWPCGPARRRSPPGTTCPAGW